MNMIRLSIIFPLLLMAMSCGKRELDPVYAISGKYVPVSDGLTAIGGDLGGIFTFMIIPKEAAQPRLVNYAMGGKGYEWQGVIRFQNQRQVNFEARCDRKKQGSILVIDSNKFDLGKGEIFLLGSNSSVEQILGSKAGRRNDSDLANRLAGIYRDKVGEAAPSNGDKPSK